MTSAPQQDTELRGLRERHVGRHSSDRDELVGSLTGLSFPDVRKREFARLDARDNAYLDVTGSALPFETHVAWHADLLREEIFGNPHSANPPSVTSSRWLEAARAATLAFIDADPAVYEVVFTANASAAAKLVGEAFPFDSRRRVVLTADNHNSVLGIREYARIAQAEVRYVSLDEELRLGDVSHVLDAGGLSHRGLFAFPAQSNFSGVRHPLELVRFAQSLGYDVLLDAAAFVPTTRLSLREFPADFVSLSFYKVLGYPTGLGALVARRDALARLRRPWFAGGTVEFSSVQNDLHLLRTGADGFQDGTPNFLGLSAIPLGLAYVESIGIARIGEHVRRLTQMLLAGLAELRHANGRPLVAIYGPRSDDARGATVAFNLVDHVGRWIHHEVVETHVADRGVSVRSGCFCNPGAAERAFGFEPTRTASCIDRARRASAAAEFSRPAFDRCMDGPPVGAVRASLGVASNARDVERLLEALEEWRR